MQITEPQLTLLGGVSFGLGVGALTTTMLGNPSVAMYSSAIISAVALFMLLKNRVKN